MKSFILKTIVFWGVLFKASECFALISEVSSYVKQYQFGVDYSNSTDFLNLSYVTDGSGSLPSSCEWVSEAHTQKRCHVGMLGGSHSGFGIFLQKAFKKQNFFYFDWDVSFGARYLHGEIARSSRSLNGLPLKSAEFSLGAIVAKPFLQFGITPNRFPDILISMGPALQFAAGTFKINGQSKNTAFGTSSVSGPFSIIRGFFELEIVPWRFGDGALSFVASRDVTGQGRGTKVYPYSIDGMSDFRGVFSRNVDGDAFGFGVKLLTRWP